MRGRGAAEIADAPEGSLEARARFARRIFDLLWPIVLAVAGLVTFVVLLAVPGLGSAPVYAVVGGMLTGGTVVGLSFTFRHRSDDG